MLATLFIFLPALGMKFSGELEKVAQHSEHTHTHTHTYNASFLHELAMQISPDVFHPIVELQDEKDLHAKLEDAVHQALTKHAWSAIEVKFPEWNIPLDMSEEPPYKFQFEKKSRTMGAYKASDGFLLISANTDRSLQGIDWYGSKRDPAIGNDHEFEVLGMTGRHRVSEQDAMKNIHSKHLVVNVQYFQCAYFGHAMANVFDRFSALLPGARKAGYKVSVVIPNGGPRSEWSENTRVIFNSMGIDVLPEPPATPHRAVGMSLLHPWDHTLRKGMQYEFHRAFLANEKAPNCDDPSQPHKKIFLSRRTGSANGRWVGGTEHLEKMLQQKRWTVIDNLKGTPVREIAREIYQACSLAGCAGGNLMNMVFLPPGAKVVEFNPFGLYADFWLAAHSYGFRWKHKVTSSSHISQAEAEQLAMFAEL